MLDRSNPKDALVSDDAIIVGGGLAGLFCALRLAPRPVTVIAAAKPRQGVANEQLNAVRRRSAKSCPRRLRR